MKTLSNSFYYALTAWFLVGFLLALKVYEIKYIISMTLAFSAMMGIFYGRRGNFLTNKIRAYLNSLIFFLGSFLFVFLENKDDFFWWGILFIFCFMFLVVFVATVLSFKLSSAIAARPAIKPVIEKDNPGLEFRGAKEIRENTFSYLFVFHDTSWGPVTKSTPKIFVPHCSVEIFNGITFDNLSSEASYVHYEASAAHPYWPSDVFLWITCRDIPNKELGLRFNISLKGDETCRDSWFPALGEYAVGEPKLEGVYSNMYLINFNQGNVAKASKTIRKKKDFKPL